MRLSLNQKFILKKLKQFNATDGFADFLNHKNAFGRLSTGVLGFTTEKELVAKCEEKNLTYLDVSSERLPYDILVHKMKIQTKCSCRLNALDIRPTRPIVGTLIRAYKKTDYDLLAVKNLNTNLWYFVPSSILIDPKNPQYLQTFFKWKDYPSYINKWDYLFNIKTTTRKITKSILKKEEWQRSDHNNT